MSVQTSGRMFDESSLISRNLRIDGKRTSVRLEPRFWELLDRISDQRGTDLNSIATECDAHRTKGSFTSALRVFVLDWLDPEINDKP